MGSVSMWLGWVDSWLGVGGRMFVSKREEKNTTITSLSASLTLQGEMFFDHCGKDIIYYN